MVELAVRIALGATLAGARLGRRPARRRRPFVAVKAPAFSTAKLRGVDPSVGPGHAVDRRGHRDRTTDPRVALAKALARRVARPAAAGRRTGALALLSIADRDKGTLGAARRRRWPAAGYRLAATAGTRDGPGGGRATRRGPSPSSARRPTRRPARSRSSTLIASRRGPARRQHADAALGRGPRRRRDPPRRDRRGDPVPDRDRDRGRGRRGARPGDRSTRLAEVRLARRSGCPRR